MSTIIGSFNIDGVDTIFNRIEVITDESSPSRKNVRIFGGSISSSDSTEPALSIVRNTSDEAGVGTLILDKVVISGQTGGDVDAVVIESELGDGGFGDIFHRTIDGVQVRNSSRNGMTIDGVDRLRISDSRFHGNAEHQLYINDTIEYVIHDSIFGGLENLSAPLDADNTYDCIHVAGDSDDGNIHDNQLMETQAANEFRYAINISASTVDGTQVHHNMGDAGAGTAFFNDAGTGTQLLDKDRTITRFSNVGTATYDGSAEYRAYFPIAQTVVSVEAALGGQPTGQEYQVDIHMNGTTIFPTQSNRPIIAVSTNLGVATLETTAIPAANYLTMDIDQVGSGATGEFLTVTVVTEAA